jgi:hypothetical protein
MSDAGGHCVCASGAPKVASTPVVIAPTQVNVRADVFDCMSGGRFIARDYNDGEPV